MATLKSAVSCCSVKQMSGRGTLSDFPLPSFALSFYSAHVNFLLLSSVKKLRCIALLRKATLKSAVCWSPRTQTSPLLVAGGAAIFAFVILYSHVAFVSMFAERAKVLFKWPSTTARPALLRIFGVSALGNDALSRLVPAPCSA